MSFTSSDVVSIARAHLKDDIPPYRFDTSDFYPSLDSAINILFSKRSELFLKSDGTYNGITPSPGTIFLADQWRYPLAAYVAYEMYLSEHADVNNLNMASLHKRDWDEALAIL